MAVTIIPTDLRVDGSIEATSGVASIATAAVNNAQIGAAAGIARTKLEQNALAVFTQKLTDCKVFDAVHTNAPGTPASDDLGLVGGTHGTNSLTMQTSDLKAAGSTDMKTRIQIVIPPEYDDGETVQIRIHGGMKTTVSDTTATVDLDVRESDKDETNSADLCTTAAQDINSLTFGTDDFTITSTSLISGDVLDVLITVNVNDAATGTAVIGVIGSIELLCDIKG